MIVGVSASVSLSAEIPNGFMSEISANKAKQKSLP